MTMTKEATTPRIYVASLSDYNAGRLHGVWIDATQDDDEIAEQVQAMLASSKEIGAEEYAIHDFEGFEGLTIGEYDSLESVAEIARLIEEHGPAYAAYVNNEGAKYATAEGFEESYAGEWSSVEEYAQELAEDIMPSREAAELAQTWPFNCIDWERAALELTIGGDIWTADAPNGSVWVFRSL